MPNTYLTVPFKEKDSAKALGARWDGAARRWFVPEGRDLTPFAQWLSVGVTSSELAPIDSDAALPAELLQRAVPLSRLLGGVAQAISAAYSLGVWTTAEVLRASARDGHVYLELSERDSEGRVLAKANAAIWARTAQHIVPEFERVTGATLGAGIKLMVRAKPVFKPQFGFSLEIDAIDPAYTIGDLEAKRRDIRRRLKDDHLFDRNRRLPPPWDFTKVLVVSPASAAGLGDFAKEADRLEQFGLCKFQYVHSRFQGEGAAAEVRQALMEGLSQFSTEQPDAVIVIRGGGAVNDLAWLDDYDLARCICECPVPVLTGIGHERDSVLLDEVAHASFDTPSKVIGGVEQQMGLRAREAREYFDAVVRATSMEIDRTKDRTRLLDQEVKRFANSVVTRAKAICRDTIVELQLDAVRTVHAASSGVAGVMSDVRAGAVQSLSEANQLVPAFLDAVRAEAFASVKSARITLKSVFPTTLDRAVLDVRRARSGVDSSFGDVVDRSLRTVQTASDGADALFREVAGQGPEKTLARGFAMVRAGSGMAITTAATAAEQQHIVVCFHDGHVAAEVESHASASSEQPQGLENQNGT